MTKFEIAKHIAENHNRLVNIFASEGVKLLNADSVILMGDTIRDLRIMAQQLLSEAEDETQEGVQEGSAEQ